MNITPSEQILDAAKVKFAKLITNEDMLDAKVAVTVSALTAEEAIGRPSRRDFPIIEGKEQVIEAKINGARGHAFTDSPKDFSGPLREVLDLDLSSNQSRAVFIASLNAALCSLGVIDNSVHCRDDDPEKCGKEIAAHVRKQWGDVRVGLIGLNPAIAEALVSELGADNVKITDLNRKNAGAMKFGVTVLDGRIQTEELIQSSDLVILTGTTLVNNTFDNIFSFINRYGKDYIIYGITAAGISELMGLNRICPYGRSCRNDESRSG